MADEFDLCECSWLSHQMSMRRLLSMLRDGQEYCTETECLTDSPSAEHASKDFVLMGVIFVVMMVMFVMRTYTRNTTRGNPELDKPKPFPGQGSDEPPNPPPAAN